MFTINSNRTIGSFSSKNIYNPEDYSLDFLKEKIKPLCYYLYSVVGTRFFHVMIYLVEITDDFPIEQIMLIQFRPPISCFLQKIERYFNGKKTKFCHLMPSKPFRIMVIQWENEEEEMLLYQMYLQNRNFTGPGILLTDRFELYPDIEEEIRNKTN